MLRPEKICSNTKCGNSKRSKMKVWLLCKQCGEPYLTAARLQDARKYCSRKCQVSSEDFKRIQGSKFKKFNQTPEARLKSRNNMKSLHQDAVFCAAHAKRSSERLTSMWQEDEFRKTHSELSSRVMSNNWKDPKFAAIVRTAASKSMTSKMKDPDYRKMMKEVHQKTIIGRWCGVYPNRQRLLYERLLGIYRYDCAYEYHVFVDMLQGAGASFYRLDIAIISKTVNIEVDGWSHDSITAKDYDKVRDDTLCQLGWKVIRYGMKILIEI